MKELTELDGELKHSAETVATLLSTLMTQAKALTTPQSKASGPLATPGSKASGEEEGTGPMQQADLELFPTQCMRRLYLQVGHHRHDRHMILISILEERGLPLSPRRPIHCLEPPRDRDGVSTTRPSPFLPPPPLLGPVVEPAHSGDC